MIFQEMLDRLLNEEKWIPDNLKKGALSKQLGKKEGEKISFSEINKKIKYIQSKERPLKKSDNKLLKRLILARTLKKFNK
jgi:hypothetical protein